MHFFWDNLGRKDIIRSLSSAVFEPRTSTGSEPFSILNCLDATKFVLLRVFTLIETICAKNCLKSRLKNAKVYVRLMCVTQKRRSFNSLITGWTDGWMSRLIPNVFRVFQFIPNTIGNRGSSVFKRLPAFSKGSRLFADMSINHASARALPVLY